MQYPTLFSKQWFLLSALFIHCCCAVLLVCMSDNYGALVEIPTKIFLNLQARLHSISSSTHPINQSEQQIIQTTSVVANTQKQAALKKRIVVADSTKVDGTGYSYNKSLAGTALIDKKSTLTVPAMTHETMYSNYCARMIRHLQATARHMHALNFLLKKIHGIKTARIRLVIARDGSLLEAEIVSSSNLTELDQLILKSIKMAHPYPPLPNYFPSNTFVYDGWFSVQGLK